MSSERGPASSEGVVGAKSAPCSPRFGEISECDIADLASVLERVMTPDATFEGMHPINALHGASVSLTAGLYPCRLRISGF